MADFSIIIITYNEEVHLPRLLSSIQLLSAPTFIIDSGSTDRTIEIATQSNCTVLSNPFINHPQQWDFALKNCAVTTPWTIGLDADQYLSEALINILSNFKNQDIEPTVNGIFFNRHNYFQGKRLKYGSYRNFFMLKMFRTGLGSSDLNENMDHRFIVPGKTIRWKEGVLNEHNIKEDDIDFWIQKHIKYSSLVAAEEWERINGTRRSLNRRNAFGNPDERRAFMKSIWWKLPLFVRPFIYFFYRFIILGGFLESGEGRMFHFLQSFWFRMLVDFKIKKLSVKNR